MRRQTPKSIFRCPLHPVLLSDWVGTTFSFSFPSHLYSTRQYPSTKGRRWSIWNRFKRCTILQRLLDRWWVSFFFGSFHFTKTIYFFSCHSVAYTCHHSLSLASTEWCAFRVRKCETTRPPLPITWNGWRLKRSRRTRWWVRFWFFFLLLLTLFKQQLERHTPLARKCEVGLFFYFLFFTHWAWPHWTFRAPLELGNSVWRIIIKVS